MKSTTCSEYLKKFQMVVDVIESFGVSFGNHPDLATESLKEMNVTYPSSEENRKSDITAHHK